MRFHLQIVLGNEAMQTPEDVAKALRDIADKLENSNTFQDRTGGSLIHDLNGNRVGGYGVVK